MFDIVLHNCLIVDGTGGSRYRGDIGITGDRIACISRLSGAAAGSAGADRAGTGVSTGVAAGAGRLKGTLTLDVEGYTVAPGFIDIHSHADRSILANPYCRSSLGQGITTVVAGNCGSSQAPLNDRIRQRIKERARQSGVEPASDLDWDDLDGFLSSVEDLGVGVNLAMFVGQGSVRNYVMGHEDRQPTAGELSQMKSLVRSSMEQGAFGLSTGRTYMPGRQAGPEEIAELAREIVEFDGLYACHMTSEGDSILDGIEEVGDIARATRCRPHIVHCKVVGRRNWGKAPLALAAIERLRESGLDLMFDVYPYKYAQVSTLKGLLGGATPRLNIGEILSSLRRDTSRMVAEAEQQMLRDPAHASGLGSRGIVWCQDTKEHEWKSIDELAEELGLSVVQTIVWLAAENHLGVKIAHMMDEAEVELIIRHPFSMICTDAVTHDSHEDTTGSLHPRGFGTYPRVLGHYVRGLGSLSLEEAVRKMTSIPAQRVGIKQRGAIQQGNYADLVVFDRNTIADRATLDKPSASPAGIRHILVNGCLAVKDGVFTGERRGSVLRRG